MIRVFFYFLHSSLVTTALFDREVNCRRAASVSKPSMFQDSLDRFNSILHFNFWIGDNGKSSNSEQHEKKVCLNFDDNVDQGEG